MKSIIIESKLVIIDKNEYQRVDTVKRIIVLLIIKKQIYHYFTIRKN